MGYGKPLQILCHICSHLLFGGVDSSGAATQRFVEAFSNISRLCEAISSFSSVYDVQQLAEKMDLMNTKINVLVLGLASGVVWIVAKFFLCIDETLAEMAINGGKCSCQKPFRCQ